MLFIGSRLALTARKINQVQFTNKNTHAGTKVKLKEKIFTPRWLFSVESTNLTQNIFRLMV